MPAGRRCRCRAALASRWTLEDGKQTPRFSRGADLPTAHRKFLDAPPAIGGPKPREGRDTMGYYDDITVTDDHIEIHPDVFVLDALVDWNLSHANSPELVVVVSDAISTSEFTARWQVAGDVLGVNGHGLYRSWSLQDEVHPPADASPRTDTERVAFAGDSPDRDLVPNYPHVTAQRVRESGTEAINVLFKRDSLHHSVTTIPTEADVVQGIVARYINGSLGSDDVSYCFAKRDRGVVRGGFRSGPRAREDYLPYNDPDEVVLVSDRVSGWVPARREDVSESDTVLNG